MEPAAGGGCFPRWQLVLLGLALRWPGPMLTSESFQLLHVRSLFPVTTFFMCFDHSLSESRGGAELSRLGTPRITPPPPLVVTGPSLWASGPAQKQRTTACCGLRLLTAPRGPKRAGLGFSSLSWLPSISSVSRTRKSPGFPAGWGVRVGVGVGGLEAG